MLNDIGRHPLRKQGLTKENDMMKVKLVNSSGCDLDTIEAPNNAKAFEKIAEQWLENLTAGDKIVILHADEDDEVDVNDFNYVGSRHHY